jgi:flagellar hook-associated protein 1
MAKISGLLDMGRRGMMLNQSAIQTTSHNIANKSTEGYSRQRVDFKSSPSTDEGRYQLGTGAKLANISRTNNPWIEKQLERENSQFSNLDQKAKALGRLESALNEQSIKGINDGIAGFFNSFRELANSPESVVARTQVREAAITLVKRFQDAREQLDDVHVDMNKNISFAVNEVNQLAKELAAVNEEIQRIEMGSNMESANDARDYRDMLVKKLSAKMNVSHAEDAHTGMVNLQAGRSIIMVAGTTFNQLKTVEDTNGKTRIMQELSEGGTQLDVTDQFTQGQIGAAIEVRDTTTDQMIDNLENLAANLFAEVNKAHREGYDRQNGLGGDFFEVQDPQKGFSVYNMSVAKAIAKDVSRIAAAAQPNAPGDNTVANLIHSLQSRPMMDGQYSYDDYYNAKVSEIGVLTQRIGTSLEGQKNSLDQMQNIRDSISGVSMDEEAAKLIEYQKSFEASARLIKTADEMFDTVLNLKRM